MALYDLCSVPLYSRSCIMSHTSGTNYAAVLISVPVFSCLSVHDAVYFLFVGRAQTRDRKVASSNPGRSDERIFFSIDNFL